MPADASRGVGNVGKPANSNVRDLKDYRECCISKTRGVVSDDFEPGTGTVLVGDRWSYPFDEDNFDVFEAFAERFYERDVRVGLEYTTEVLKESAIGAFFSELEERFNKGKFSYTIHDMLESWYKISYALSTGVFLKEEIERKRERESIWEFGARPPRHE